MEPRVYQCPRRWMVVFVCFGCFLMADGLFLFLLPIWVPVKNVWGEVLAVVLGCGGCGMGSLMLVSTLTGHIELYPDAIVARSALPFGNRRLERKDIAAKMVMFTPVKTYVLYSRKRDQKKLRLGMLGNEDEYFREWMHDIPDADKKFLRNRLFGNW